MISIPIVAVFLCGQGSPLSLALPAKAECRLGSTKLRYPGDPAKTFFSPDGKRLVVLSGGISILRPESVTVFDTAIGRVLARFRLPPSLSVDVAHAARGRSLFAGYTPQARPSEVVIARLDLTTGKAVTVVRTADPAGRMATAALAADGSRAVVTSRTRVEVFALPGGRRVGGWRPPEGVKLRTAYIDAAGRFAAVSALKEGGLVRVIEFPAGKVVMRADLGNMPLVQFLADGRTAVTQSMATRGAVQFWDAVTGRLLGSPRLPEKTNGVMVFRPLAEGGAAVALSRRVILFDRRGRVVRTSPSVEGRIQTLRPLPAGRLLVNVREGDELYIEIWKQDDFRRRRLKGKGKLAAVSLDGRLAALQGPSHQTFRLIDLKKDRTRVTAEGAGGLLAARFAPGGRVVTYRRGGPITTRDARTGRAVRRVAGPNLIYPGPADVSPDGATLAAADYDEVVLVSVESGNTIRRLGGFGRSLRTVRFSPDGRRVIGFNYAHNTQAAVAVWGATGGTPRVTEGPAGPGVKPAAVSLGGRVIVWADWRTETATLQDLGGGRKSSIAGVGTFARFCFSPGGGLLAAWPLADPGVDDDITSWHLGVFEVVTGRLVRRVSAADLTPGGFWPGHWPATRVAFAPGGRSLAAFDPAGPLRLIDTVAGGTYREFRGHFANGPLSFSPDGRFLASFSPEAPGFVWPVPPRK